MPPMGPVGPLRGVLVPVVVEVPVDVVVPAVPVVAVVVPVDPLVPTALESLAFARPPVTFS